ncbi:MMPL family transporter [Sneathiella marina]|uniref:MMPL family transporter n=1 Tax=Sneathiella marina TaxID=2950108 RepID=A0ABY4W506_9PROT|nr:MMPL family transporter [Sneathiella marina]USG62285.1 MMPL family transporter [Sneathiella marina]
MGSYSLSLEARLLAGCLCLAAVIFTLFISLVDLRPQVTPDFFFGSNDPDLAQSEQIRALFPSDEFLIVSVASDDIGSEKYLSRLTALSADMGKIDGILRIVSVADGPGNIDEARDSPFWRPLLISEGEEATLIIAFVKSPAPENLVAEVEAATRLFDTEGSFQIRLSGMPYIVDQIRRSLVHDIKIFSSSALAIFTLVLLLVFRSPMIALGAAVSGISAVFLTLIMLQLLGQPMGILTANLAIIIFVLVQSQLIYLTSNWRQIQVEQKFEAVRQAVLKTFKASLWCMITTLLGFATLLFVAAEPLRQLGGGGMIGAFSALLCSFLIYPAFLLYATRRPAKNKSRPGTHQSKGASWLRASAAVLLLAVAILSIPGLLRLNTDPSLFSYFDEGGELHEGLTFVDANGGSSPMSLVVRMKNGNSLDNESSYEAMWKLHNALLAHKEVGTVISLPALMAEANNHPLAFILPWREIISLLSSDFNQRIAESFLTEDRNQTLYILRMKEGGRLQDRNSVTTELQAIVDDVGFETSLTGGVYALQGRLSDLVASSLSTGVIALLALFVGIGFIVTRSVALTAAMGATAALIPLTILGGWGWLRVPVDIISAPAANVCFGIAVDALIHLAIAVKQRLSISKTRDAWTAALKEQTPGVLASSGIIAIGFVIFAYSGFPPTTRFGGAIVIGSIFAGGATLCLFPLLGQLFMRFSRSK